jgi:hypothetical protein
MIVQTGNSTYQLSGVGSKFEVRKLSNNPSASVATMESIFGDSFVLKTGESFMLFDGGKRMLATSPVVAVLG